MRVGCASSLLGGRVTQFDLWPEFSLSDPVLVGRSALLLGGRAEQWGALFGRVERIEPIHGDHKARPAFVGWDYHGIGPPAKSLTQESF